MYKEYLAEFWYSAKSLENSKVSFSTPTGGIYGEVGVNTFRDVIGAHYLPHSSEYFAPPSIDIVRPWFETIGHGEVVPAKGTLKKSLLPPRWSLEPKPGHKKLSTSSKQSPVSSKEATKGGSSKAPTSSKTGHSKKRKESSSAMDSNLSQPLVSTPIDTGMHKEDRQATGGPTSLGVTSEAIANPQLSSGMFASNLNKPIYSASFIVHSESASGCDASADSTAEADLRLSAPSDFVPQKQDKTKSVSEGLETVLTQPITGKRVSSNTRQVEEEEASNTIKLEDLAKLVSHVQPSFKDLDSSEDDPVIVVDDSDEDEETEKDEVYPTPNAKSENNSSQKHKLELEKNKAEAEATLLKAQPSFPNVEQLKELLEFPVEFLSLPAQVASVQAKLKTLDALPSLLLNVTQALNKFAQVLDFASSKAGDQSVPSAGQADTMPATNQATIS
ncbi:hypothetical protein Tco_1509473 [Tanacetum coccineum]